MEKKIIYKIGFYSALILTISVCCFGICIVASLLGIDTHYLSYISSFLIAAAFICLMIANFYYADHGRKIWGLMALSFSLIYAVLVMIVYYLQITFVNNNYSNLSDDILWVVKFEPGTAVFALDLLGYAFMALATFFAGLIFNSRRKNEKWIKRLLLFHGLFFIPCFIFPMIRFPTEEASTDSLDLFGSIGYVCWCILFSTISISSARLYFYHWKNIEAKNKEGNP